MLCPFCGWGDQVKTQFGEQQCSSRKAAKECDLNERNVHRYWLRYKPVPGCMPKIVRSVRYQGKEGKGDSYEQLLPLW